VVFNVYNDYVTLQAQGFRVRKRVAGQQHSWIIPKRLERLFLQLFIHTPVRGYKIREHRAAKNYVGLFD
jgi:hypothetical protein